ncbi:MAG TPA: LysE family transporter [Burkholderiales bacterium]|nr:LysE family transporter [Burkholderiales bacterium]
MEMTGAVLAIAGAITLGAMSPGPSFLMVARVSIAASRADGLAAALGMGAGGVLFAVMALAGLHVVLIAVPWLYAVLKIAGGAYLIFIGWMIWRAARQPVLLADGSGNAPRTLLRSFWLALLTQVSNPKAAVVYASVFVSLLPREIPLSVTFILPPIIFVIEAGWYAIVALALSAPSPRAAYLRWKVWIDRAAGTVMAGLGLRLILGAK